jgi:hypothetical protein
MVQVQTSLLSQKEIQDSIEGFIKPFEADPT